MILLRLYLAFWNDMREEYFSKMYIYKRIKLRIAIKLHMQRFYLGLIRVWLKIIFVPVLRMVNQVNGNFVQVLKKVI